MSTLRAANLWPSIIIFLGLSGACSASPNRLPPLERHFYGVLKTPAEQSGFLKMNEETRKAYLVDRGYMREWERLTPPQREAVLRREVQVEMTQFGAHLAWGLPADSHEEGTPTTRAVIETYIRCTSGPKTDDYVRDNLECDGTSAEIQVRIVDGRVVAISHLD
jgi:hypothetical protein